MADPSSLFFPLRSNASALVAGPSVAAVRRRILVAGLLHDQVILESGIHYTWAGPGGANEMTAHGESPPRWQTLRERGRVTGAGHFVRIRRGDAPPDAPFHTVIHTDATFSWRATFEPFRRELPTSAAKWLEFGFVRDEQPARRVVQGWESEGRRARLVRHLAGKPPAVEDETRPSRQAIVKAGYFDLATAALTGVGLSIDRRHQTAIAARLAASEAERIGGHYALEILLPAGFGWADVPALRRMRALRDYRAILRDVEDAALSSDCASDLGRRVHAEYAERLAKASAHGLPAGGRIALAFVGFVVGAVADTRLPLVGGAIATAATLAAEEGIDRLRRPRWLSVHRRMRTGPDGL
jgi:hypothetical protein